MSSRGVAQMPWDPKPLQPPANTSNTSSQNGTPLQSYQRPPVPANNENGVRIKAEPGTEYNGNGNQNGQGYMHQAMNPALAQQRAASLLQQQFGSQANASLGAMQQRGIALPGQQKAPGGIQFPGQNLEQMQQQYAQQLKQQQAAQQPRIKVENESSQHGNGQFQQQQQSQQQQQQQEQKPNVAYAQTDGADEFEEWSKQLAAGRAVSAEQIAANDRIIRDQVSRLATDLDGGLMVPLKQRKRPTKKSRRIRRAVSTTTGLPAIPQMDGDFSEDEKVGIKDEEDEDAINSDLDSSGEDDARADEDDDDIDSMLCTYDKVQRVKNKWKCTLKDGILLANGKEYLFHKAQGEFEW